MDRWSRAWRLTGIGWYIGICIGGGVWLGVWLDGKWNTGGILVFVGIALGLGLAGWGIYRMVMPLMEKDDEERK